MEDCNDTAVGIHSYRCRNTILLRKEYYSYKGGDTIPMKEAILSLCRSRYYRSEGGDAMWVCLPRMHPMWKSRAHLPPEGKVALTPENLFVLTPVKS